MARKSDTAFVDGGEVEITRPEKVLFPDDGFTKGALISYYRDVGPGMLPDFRDAALLEAATTGHGTVSRRD
jgi:bifunctional non-homologous end joining protein LigD